MPDEIAPRRWILWLFVILSGVLTAGVVYCYFIKPPKTRPLPAFRGVRVFNGTAGTRPDTVTEKHRRYSAPDPSQPAPIPPPPPKDVSTYTPTSQVSDAYQVELTLVIPGGTAPINVVVQRNNPSGSYLLEVDVILSDTDATHVTAAARALWYRPAEPYWNWDDGATISGVPCTAQRNAVPTAQELSQRTAPLVDESLFNARGSELRLSQIEYVRRSFPDPSGIAWTDPLLRYDLLSLPAMTAYRDVYAVRASVQGYATKGIQVDVQDRDHVYAAYFLALPSGTISGGAIVQSDVAPYWYFK